MKKSLLTKTKPVIQLLDTFCGAGGSSTGAIMAIEEMGKTPALTCVNHNPQAIATHTVNHPWARHYCTGVDDLNLRSMFGDTLLDILWSSPSCTHFSTARGGTPVNEQDRATAWCVVRIADTLKPPIILIENVAAFATWGPTTRKWNSKNKQWEVRPDPQRKGETFQAWLGAMRSLGYTVDHRILCCADYGDPTTRERLFIQCALGKRKIVWPNPTHASTKKIKAMVEEQQGSLLPEKPLLPWVPARDIIDWSLSGTSIFERKKSLVQKTLRRIFLGLDRIGLKDFQPDPFITTIDQKSVTHHTGRDIADPVSTVCTENRHALVETQIQPVSKEFIVHQMGKSAAQDPNGPLSAITGGPKHYVAEPKLEPCMVKLRQTSTIARLDDPSPTITAGGTHLGLMVAEVQALLPQQSAGLLRETKNPSPTVAGAGAIALIEAKASPMLVQVNHAESGSGASRIKSLDEPVPTVCGNRGEWAQCQPYLTPNFGEREGQAPRCHSLDEPAPAVTGHGAGCLIHPQIKPLQKKAGKVQVDPEIRQLCEEVLCALDLKNFSFHGEWSPEGRPIIEIQGQKFVLEINFRMLQPHELAAAQGFPKGYKFEGNKSEVIKQIGNAVPCHTARALVKAVLTGDPDVGVAQPPMNENSLWAAMAKGEILLQEESEEKELVA
jgi:DNA (cytosine-5)-methyltransferase 1